MRYVLSLVLVLSVSLVPCAAAQSPIASSNQPPRIVEIMGPRTLEAGAVVHFRARAAGRSTSPVRYLWDFGDGTLSIGGLVSYAYATPGSYTVTVVGRNEAGSDTLRAAVHVRRSPDQAGPRPAPAVPQEDVVREAPPEDDKPRDRPRRARVEEAPKALALYGSGGLVPERGGYTWVLATDLWPERAQDRMLRYRLQGFRADVYVDTAGRGTPAHRIVLGQFATKTEALAARPQLPAAGVRPWLLEVGAADAGAESQAP